MRLSPSISHVPAVSILLSLALVTFPAHARTHLRRQFPTLNSDEPPPVSLQTAFTDDPSSTPIAIPSASVLPSPTPSALAPSAPLSPVVPTANNEGDGEEMVRVRETIVEHESPVGTITSHCLVLVSDPSQTFCRTLLDGQPLGNDAGMGALQPQSVSVFTSPTITAASASLAVPRSTDVSVITADQPTSGVTVGSTAVTALASSTASPLVSSATVESAPAPSLGRSVEPSPTAVPASIPMESAPAPSLAPSVSFEPSPTAVPAGIAIESTPGARLASSVSTEPTTAISASTASVDPSDTLSAPRPVLTMTIAAISSASSPIIASASASISAIDAAFAQNDINPDEIPGQTMSVLPIGLGVLGGLIGIALVIVGFMVWQRRRYRQQFISRLEAAEGKGV